MNEQECRQEWETVVMDLPCPQFETPDDEWFEDFECARRAARRLLREIVVPWARETSPCKCCEIGGEPHVNMRRGRYLVVTGCQNFSAHVDILVSVECNIVVVFSYWCSSAAIYITLEDELADFERVREWLHDRRTVALRRRQASRN